MSINAVEIQFRHSFASVTLSASLQSLWRAKNETVADIDDNGMFEILSRKKPFKRGYHSTGSTDRPVLLSCPLRQS